MSNSCICREKTPAPSGYHRNPRRVFKAWRKMIKMFLAFDACVRKRSKQMRISAVIFVKEYDERC